MTSPIDSSNASKKYFPHTAYRPHSRMDKTNVVKGKQLVSLDEGYMGVPCIFLVSS